MEAVVLITQFDPCMCSWLDVSDPKALIRVFGKVMVSIASFTVYYIAFIYHICD